MAVNKPKIRRGQSGSPIIRAVQGNFDHLMGALRNIAGAHNQLNDDVLAMEQTIEIVSQTAEDAGNDLDDHLADTTAVHDHGSLSGLGDDDHTQYAALAQNETISGRWTHTDAIRINAGLDSGTGINGSSLDIDGSYIRIGNELDSGTISNGMGIKFTHNGSAHASLIYTAAGSSSTLTFGETSSHSQLSPLDTTVFSLGATSGRLSLPITGSGAGILIGGDTHIYRAAANLLQLGSGDSFVIGPGDNTTDQLKFGSAQDVNLYRAGANSLKTDDNLTGGSHFYLDKSTDYEMVLGSTGTDRFRFSTWDSKQYLQTDDELRITAITGFGTFDPIFTFHQSGALSFGAAQDTYIYRSAADNLSTPDNFNVGGGLSVAGSQFSTAVTVSTGVTDIPLGLVLKGNYSARVISSQNAAGQESFGLHQNGTLYWADGAGAASDTNLYRESANILKTDDAFVSGRWMQIDTDSLSGLDGRLYFGDSADVNLYRASANVLKTDDTLTVGGNLNMDTTDTGLGIYFGSTADVSLYRSAAATLKTNNALVVNNSTTTSDVRTMYVQGLDIDGSYLDFDTFDHEIAVVSRDGGLAGLLFGSAGDTNLYRSAANTLATSDAFDATGQVVTHAYFQAQIPSVGDVGFYQYVSGDAANAFYIAGRGAMVWGDGTGAGDVTLYRSGANQLATNDSLLLAGDLSDGTGYIHQLNADGGSIKYIAGRPGISNAGWTVQLGDASGGSLVTHFGFDSGGKMLFGNAEDTNLYRSGANSLATDDDFLMFGAAPTFYGGTASSDFYLGSSANNNATHLRGGTVNIITEASGSGIERVRFPSSNTVDLGASTKLQWGTAFGTNDTNLYRSAANVLKTDDKLIVGLGVDVLGDNIDLQGGAGTGGIYFSSGAGGRIYNDSGFHIRTNAPWLFDAQVVATANISIDGSADTPQFIVKGHSTQTSNMVLFEQDGGTDLWWLTNDGHVGMKGDLYLRSAGGKINFGAADDVNLYRSAADTLKTDDVFVAADDLYVDGNFYYASGTAGDGDFLVWDSGLGYWVPAAGASGSGVAVESDNVSVDATVATLDFAHGLDVTTDGASEVNIAVDESELDHGTLAGLSDDDHPQYGALAQNETVTGAWSFVQASTTTVIVKRGDAGNGFKLIDDGDRLNFRSTDVASQKQITLRNTGRVGVGVDATGSAQLAVENASDAADTVLTLRGHASQSGNLLLIEQSGGTDVVTLTNAGVLTNLGQIVQNGGKNVLDTDHTAAADPHTGYRLESADHSHASTGLQGGQIAGADLTGTPGGELGGTFASFTVDATHSGSTHAGAAAAETVDIRAADVLVGTATAAFGAEIVVGTTPNGELGGTWGAITVDATHSGSSHAGVISTHEAAGDPHTGYRLESADHSHQTTGAQAGQLDHGAALTGLSDDDHPQYGAIAQNETISGEWTFANATVVDGSADEIQLKVRGHSTQTTDVFVVEKDDNTDILTVQGNGRIVMLDDLDVGADLSVTGNTILTSPLTVNNTQLIDGSTDGIQLWVVGHSSQTSPIFRVDSFTTTGLLSVSAAGVITNLGKRMLTTDDASYASSWKYS